jgi:hypothetical protein
MGTSSIGTVFLVGAGPGDPQLPGKHCLAGSPANGYKLVL